MNLNLNLSGQLAQQQQLNLAPQLLQWLRLLQAPAQRIDELIRTELEINPAIELDDSQAAEPDDLADTFDLTGEDRPDVDDDGMPALDERFELLAELDSNWAEEHVTTCGDDIRSAQDRKDYLMHTLTDAASVTETLRRQVAIMDAPAAHKAAAGIVIGSLDERGYLSCDLETLGADCELPAEDLAAGLELVQQCEPAGIAARDLEECLLLQTPDDDIERHRDARAIIRSGLEALAQGRLDAIARHLDISQERVEAAVTFIRALNPHPTRHINEAAMVTATVTPDITIRHDGKGGFEIEIEDDRLPRLRISNFCSRMLERTDLTKADIAFIRSRIRAAAFLINGLEKRGSTLRRVAEEIVRVQHRYLRGEEPGIRPLTMANVASIIGVHDTTVSRALSEKYVATPLGVMPMKNFFLTGYNCDDGTALSPDMVRQRIARLIESESPAQPIKDDDIAAALRKDGIPVARRTVAKYRGELGIPSSKERGARGRGLKVIDGGRTDSVDETPQVAMMG